MGELSQLVQGENPLPALLAHDPGRIGLDPDLGAQIRARIHPFGITFYVGQLVGGGRPEPGLLLFARGSPIGAVHDRSRLLEVARQRHLVGGWRGCGRREDESAEDDGADGHEGPIGGQG